MSRYKLQRPTIRTGDLIKYENDVVVFKTQAYQMDIVKKEYHGFYKIKIDNSKKAYDFFKQICFDASIDVFESMYAVFLNQMNVTVGFMCVSKGGISGTMADVRLILKHAIDLLATGVIIAHNHPSGNLNSSSADDTLTEKIKNAAKIMDIQLIDSLIITKDDYSSYADLGKL